MTRHTYREHGKFAKLPPKSCSHWGMFPQEEKIDPRYLTGRSYATEKDVTWVDLAIEVAAWIVVGLLLWFGFFQPVCGWRV